MIEEKYKVAAEYVETGVEGIKRTGIKVLAMKDGYVKTLMPLEGNVNHVGIMYAGSLFTIGECMGGAIYGVAFDVKRFYPIVKEVTIKFRRPVVTDVTLELEMSEKEAEGIQQEAEEKGKADYTLDLELKDTNGETVCAVNGIWQSRPVQPGSTNSEGSGGYGKPVSRRPASVRSTRGSRYVPRKGVQWIRCCPGSPSPICLGSVSSLPLQSRPAQISEGTQDSTERQHASET